MRYLYLYFLAFINISAFKCVAQSDIKIAFLADVHLQDIYGKFSDSNYTGLKNPADGTTVLIRTMESQLHSTRIFNENYFAFIAALDDIAARGIKIVALPGDYTDDGQPIHLRGLQQILKSYEDKYGISFLITTGNHDPVGPFAQHAGKDDFLGLNGGNQPVYSVKNMYSYSKGDLPVIITSDIAEMGYTGITEYLGEFGFMPKMGYLFWATPFSNYTYDTYNFKTARQQALLSSRQYEVLPGFTVPDASYVAEPVKGLWLLALDGNTYIPKDTDGNPEDSKNYKGADIGYNNVVTNKAYLIKWVKHISEEAKKHNKTLIAFSHYPMVEFNDGASPEIGQFMGPDKWQLNRVPLKEVAELFADAGLTIHFGGHMHINDTGLHTSAKGNTLLNVQTPSLAAYIPAYKVLTLRKGSIAEVETIVVDKVKGFDKLFQLYEMEYKYLKSLGKKDIWNKEILKTKTYHEFTDFHLKELVRLRFLPDDWHKDFVVLLEGLSGTELLLLASMDSKNDIEKLIKNKSKFKDVWAAAEVVAKQKVKDAGLIWEAFAGWKANGLVTDFYRIRNADELAVIDIGADRIAQYGFIAKCLASQNLNDKDIMQTDLHLLFTILGKFLSGAPANHFSYNLKTGQLKDLKK